MTQQEMFGKGIKSISPAVGVCIIGYMIGALFDDLKVATELQMFIIDANLNNFLLVIIICVLTCFLGLLENSLAQGFYQ